MDRAKVKKRVIFWYFLVWVLLFVALYLSYGVYFVDTTSTKSKWVGLFAGAVSILLATCKILEISFINSKNIVLEKVVRYFSNGTMIFIKRISKILVFLFIVLTFALKTLGFQFLTCFICGGIFSLLSIFVSGLITSKVATRASQFYAESNLVALKQLFNSGAAVACYGVGFAIIPLVILFHNFKDYQVINGFVLGAAIVALVNNVASSTAKQASQSATDVVADFVAEIEKKDRRNPLLLLNGISKSILDVNVLTSDLFVSFCAMFVASMTLGGEFLQLMGMFLPIIIAATGVFASVIAILFTRVDKGANPVKTLFISMFLANLILVLISIYLIKEWYPDCMSLVYPIAIGAFGGYIISFCQANLVFAKYKSVSNVANSAISGIQSIARETFKEGFAGVFAPAVIFTLCLIGAFLSCGGVESPSIGLYGIMLSVIASISCGGVILAVNSFGLTTGSVDVVLETYEEDLYDNRYPQANVLSTTGKCVVAIGKNYLNSMSILSAIALMISYSLLARLEQIDIMNPYVMGSIILGSSIPFIYSANCIGMVSKVARRLVLEVKRQIKNSPQILRYEMRPNYEKCVELSAINSTIQVIVNTLFIVAIGILITVKLQEEALFGFIFGAIISAFGLIFLTSGTCIVSKSARRYFESQLGAIKNVQEYETMNINEIIFSSLKDIIAPSLNSLIKFIAILAMALIPMFIK